MRSYVKRLVAAAAVAMTGLAPSAFAGGAQLDDKSLIDVLQAKGILSKDEVKAIKHNNEGKFKFGATLFVDAKNSRSKTNDITKTSTNSVDLSRAYLTARYAINNTWKVRVTTDVSLESGSNLKKKNNVFLKYAYIQGDLMPAASLRFGVIHTPWIDYEESLWGHRYASKVLTDTLGIESSADAGLGVVGKVFDGLLHYQFGEFNGGGYTNISASKALDFSGRIGSEPIKGLTLDFQYRDGYRGTKKFSGGVTTKPAAKQRMYQGMMTYGIGQDYRIGANYVRDNDKALKGVQNRAYDIWAKAKLLDTPLGKIGTFGRYEYDRVRPYDNTALLLGGSRQETIQRYLVALELVPAKGLAFSFVYDYVKTKNKITGANTAAATVGTDEIKNQTLGLFSHLKF